jgi:hypothetical protein
MATVVMQRWYESERGWGQRPDGCSLHLTEQDRAAYCKKYWADEKERNSSGVAPGGPGGHLSVYLKYDGQTIAEDSVSY